MRADWSKTIPLDTEQRVYSSRAIRYAREDLYDRFSVQFEIGTSQTQDGKSKKIILVDQAVDPTLVSSTLTLWGKSTGLWYENALVKGKFNNAWCDDSGTSAGEQTFTNTGWVAKASLASTAFKENQFYLAVFLFEEKVSAGTLSVMVSSDADLHDIGCEYNTIYSSDIFSMSFNPTFTDTSYVYNHASKIFRVDTNSTGQISLYVKMDSGSNTGYLRNITMFSKRLA